ncbi:MAG TPA: efflux RND transporter periplasmic adaptor subunit [Terriglobales bacterium]|nr:efflux RND transporter periplasmic adaptor subunit [Terriglobales bacterium]
MRLPSALLIALLAAGLAACGNSGPEAVTPVLAAAEPAPPSTQPAPAPQKRDSAFVASGPLVVEDQVDVAAQRPGVVATILVDLGQPVRKDQLLAAFDDRQLRAERDAAQARLRSDEANLKDWQAETRMAEADFRRAQGMFQAQLNTQEQLDHARYKWEGSLYEIEKGKQELLHAQANLQAASLELDKAHIRAPFDGVVARRYVRIGQEVATGDRLFWVTAVKPLRVKFTLPESFISRVRRGQMLQVTCLDEPGVSHPAKIIQVSPVVDPSSGTFEVLAELIHPGRNLRPGMTANIRLENAP